MRFDLAEESFAMQASPSKARAEALESHSWSLVLDWLSKLYHQSPVPTFERNTFTLQALQSLMGENIAAEKLRDLVYEAQLEELLTTTTTNEDKDNDVDILSGQTNPRGDRTTTTTTTDKNDPRTLLYQVQSSLSKPSRTALDSISEAAVLAGCSTSASSTAGPSRQMNTTILQDLQSSITNLPIQTFEFDTQLRSINDLISNLQGEIKDLHQKSAISTTQNKSRSQTRGSRSQRNERSTSASSGNGGGRSISSPPQTPTTLSTMTLPNDEDDDDGDEDDRHHATLHAETARHQRETKQVAIKCSEYTERITVLERQASGSSSPTNYNEPTLADVAEKQVLVDQKKKHVERLRKKILAFHNLPPDLEASRSEVRRAQAELDRLKNKREDLFAHLGSL